MVSGREVLAALGALPGGQGSLQRTNPGIAPAGIGVRGVQLGSSVPMSALRRDAGNRLLLSLPFRPQITEAPLAASLPSSAIGADTVTVVASLAPPRRPA